MPSSTFFRLVAPMFALATWCAPGCGSSSDDAASSSPGGGTTAAGASGGSNAGGGGASGSGHAGAVAAGHGGTTQGGHGGSAGKSAAAGGTGGAGAGGSSGASAGAGGSAGTTGAGGGTGVGGSGAAGSGGGASGGSGGATIAPFLGGFFPLGVFVQPPESFAKWTSRGVNTVVEVPQGGDSAAWSAAATSAGLHMVRPPLGDVASDAANPLLLAFSHPDEPDRMTDTIPASTLATSYAAWKKAAPATPVFLNFSGFAVMSNDTTNPATACNGPGDGANEGCYPSYIATADWIGNDNYPVAGYGQTPDNGLVGKTLDKVGGWVSGRPRFVYIESSDQDAPWLGTADQSRAPTPDEFRGEVWDAICHGARGIFYFPVKPFMGFSFDSTPDDVAAEMTKQNAAILDLSGVLQTDIDPAPLHITVSAPLETTWRVTAKGTFVIVLNLSASPLAQGSVAISGVSATTANVHGESRGVDVKNGALVDDFGAYGVHVYQL